MRMILTIAFLLTLVSVAGESLPPAAAAEPVLRGPAAHGVVKLGDRVDADLAGDCTRGRTWVRATLRHDVIDGPVGVGCHPTLAVPTAAELREAGYADGDPLELAVVSGSSVVPLTHSRIDPATVPAASGDPASVAKVSDPLGGGGGRAMSTGDVLDLGPVDLTGLQSVDVRNLTNGTGSWELRVGSASGTAVASGLLGAAGCFACAGDSGWFHSVSQLTYRPASSVIGDQNTIVDLTPAVGQAPHLYLAVTSLVASEPAIVNWMDLNGFGVALPHRFTEDRGFETLFDGSSFDGWSHVGPGRFVLKDGAMRAEHEPQDRGWGWLWYTRAQFSDFVLRLRFKIEEWEDNGGVLLRHVDPQGDPNRSTNSGDEVQIQEGFENLTGGIAHERDAFQLATGLVGQWNNLEVVAVGATYLVRINGVPVMRYQSKKALRGFLSVENEVFGTNGGHLWYDDIRVHRCGVRDALCSGAVSPSA